VKIFITNVSLDKEVLIEFWKSSAFEVRTLDPAQIRSPGGLNCEGRSGENFVTLQLSEQ